MRGLATTTSAPAESYEGLPDEFSLGMAPSDSEADEILERISSSDSEGYSDEQEGNTRKEIYRAEQEKVRHDTLADENVHVGFMFGSKALVQLLANPMVGPLTNK
jgi:hypothetical protein